MVQYMLMMLFTFDTYLILALKLSTSIWCKNMNEYNYNKQCGGSGAFGLGVIQFKYAEVCNCTSQSDDDGWASYKLQLKSNMSVCRVGL